MGKFSGILFCTDLDGTLYRNDKSISKENLDAIKYFKNEGGLFTFITGRVPKTSIKICETIKPNAPYGCVNGAGIYDAICKKYLWTEFLNDNVGELVYSAKNEFPQIGIQANVMDNIYFIQDNDAMVRFRSITGTPYISKSFEDIKEPILKIVFGHLEGEQLLKLEKFLNNQPGAKNFDFIRSEQRLYEILPKGTSKGNLLIKLAELLGIDRKKTIAVGDYNNDISMIQQAGVGFAVSNALDCVKAVADRITVSNEENAIATIIDELDKGNIF